MSIFKFVKVNTFTVGTSETMLSGVTHNVLVREGDKALVARAQLAAADKAVVNAATKAAKEAFASKIEEAKASIKLAADKAAEATRTFNISVNGATSTVEVKRTANLSKFKRKLKRAEVVVDHKVAEKIFAKVSATFKQDEKDLVVAKSALKALKKERNAYAAKLAAKRRNARKAKARGMSLRLWKKAAGQFAKIATGRLSIDKISASDYNRLLTYIENAKVTFRVNALAHGLRKAFSRTAILSLKTLVATYSKKNLKAIKAAMASCSEVVYQQPEIKELALAQVVANFKRNMKSLKDVINPKNRMRLKEIYISRLVNFTKVVKKHFGDTLYQKSNNVVSVFANTLVAAVGFETVWKLLG
jgi:hypothetical protein